jgi:hypothetical protein
LAKNVELNLNLSGTIRTTEDEGFASVKLTYDNQFTITAKGDVMFTLPDDKKVAVKVSYVDARGKPAKVDGAVTWSSSDDAIVSVVVDPADSTKATVTPTDNLGQAQVTATADADLGTGSRELITLLDVEVVGGEAVKGTIEPVGAPVPLPLP